jgi:MFS family permease
MDVSSSTPLRATPLALPLTAVFTLSFLAQVVQIATVPAAIALKLQSAGVTPDIIGLVAAGPWIAVLLGGRLVPRVLHRFGVVRSIAGALTVSLLAVFGMTRAMRPLDLFCLNLLFGAGLIVRWVACDTWVVALTPNHLRGRIIGAHETLMGCGIATGPIILSISENQSSTVFAICMALLALSASVLFVIKRHGITPEAEREGTRFTVLRTIPIAILGGGLAGLVETSSISFLPAMANRMVFTLGAAAVLFGFGLGGTVLQVPLGWLADRAGYRRAQLATAAVVLAGAVGILVFAKLTPALVVALFLWGGAAGGMNTLAVIEAGSQMEEHDMSTAMTSIAMAYTVGSILGPIATGVIEARAPSLGLSVAAGISAAVFLALRARQAPAEPV